MNDGIRLPDASGTGYSLSDNAAIYTTVDRPGGLPWHDYAMLSIGTKKLRESPDDETRLQRLLPGLIEETERALATMRAMLKTEDKPCSDT